MKRITRTPIVFTAVAGPMQSGIAPSGDGRRRNLAGISNWIAPPQILSDLQRLVPEQRTLGVLDDLDNPVSSSEAQEVDKVVGSIIPLSVLTPVDHVIR